MLILYDYAGGYVRGEHTNSVLAYRLRENKWVKKCGMSLARSGWDHLYICHVSYFSVQCTPSWIIGDHEQYNESEFSDLLVWAHLPCPLFACAI